MPNPRLKKTDITIITGFFILYAVGYAWLIEPKPRKETERRAEEDTAMIHKAKPKTRTAVKHIKSLSGDSQSDEASYYQDHLDEYLDDPEDEFRFPPEIFDANDD